MLSVDHPEVIATQAANEFVRDINGRTNSIEIEVNNCALYSQDNNYGTYYKVPVAVRYFSNGRIRKISSENVLVVLDENDVVDIKRIG